jgi:hypothetical protein
MDVRAVDTANMAAKRAELDHGEPLKSKGAFVLSRITPRTSQEAGGQVSRAKSSTEREQSQEREHEGHQPAEYHPGPQGQTVESSGSSDGTEHHLDVKV